MSEQTVSLAAALKAPPPRPADRGSPCPVAKLLEGLPADERQALNTALIRDSGWEHSGLSRVLTAKGHPIKQDQIGKHRRGDCRCQQ